MIRLFKSGFFDKVPTEQTRFADTPAKNNEMSSLDLELLTETSSWCSSQTFTATPEETLDIRNRRGMIVEAGKLYSEAYRCGEKYPDGPHFRRGKTLFEQADIQSLIFLHSQLRSPELLPESLSTTLSTENFSEAFATVVTNRHRHLKEANMRMVPPSAEGKLLYYWPHENLSCGAAEYSSNGFFDADNVPPWDTWVSFDGKTLLSWVPEILLPLAEAGIDANPEACISWNR
jgi:hypothetical protein